MSHCEHDRMDSSTLKVRSFRNVLWVVLIINGVMFIAEFGSAFIAKSVSLQADALDFLGDSLTYAVTLLAIGFSLSARAWIALLKGLSMGLLGLWVFGQTLYYLVNGWVPSFEIMGIMGMIALIANLISALLLYQFRIGDSNMQSTWLCSRNDAISNLAIIIAASGVFFSNTPWLDFIVAVVMASLSLTASYQIIRLSLNEMKTKNTA